jgi:hypothetical protein
MISIAVTRARAKLRQVRIAPSKVPAVENVPTCSS